MIEEKTKKILNLTRTMFGRRVIYTDVNEITDENVWGVLSTALQTHARNSNEISYLWNYYKGKQPILARTKEIRPEICNRIVENRANEIVSFKVGYLCGEPIQYVPRNGDTESINKLNNMMYSENKAFKDKELVEWQNICGTAYRLVLPNPMFDKNNVVENESPFNLYVLDPRTTFVVYSNSITKEPLMGVTYTTDTNGLTTYSVYTKDHFYRVRTGGELITNEEHLLGRNPIFEYPANNARLGAFEIVLPLLDAINNVESNRLDGLEQFVQYFIKFVNCDISEEDFEKLKELGAIKVKSTDGAPADVEIITTELNQNQAQTLIDHLYYTVLTICGMPNRNGLGSTSDTGAAVMLRDGWSDTEARAKDSELIFKQSEIEMLKLVIKLCHELADVDLRLSNIDMIFTRRNYEGVQSKSQVLVTMLAQEKIHPQLAFEACGLFTDPERAYTMSKERYDEWLKSQPTTVEETITEEDFVNVGNESYAPN